VNQAHSFADIRDRLQSLETRIEAACHRAGRARKNVTLVAVTKTVPLDAIAALAELGIKEFGESRPQELWRKADALPSCRWHLVGHLQRNKVEATVSRAALIHSVDSVRLLQALENESVKQGRRLPVLLQVNASGEKNKHGFMSDELADVLPTVETLKGVEVCGIMAMAAYSDDPQRSRPAFARTRQLADRLRHRLPPPHRFQELSMGMSNDFEVAIEEGATIIRIGTALFEGPA
jgi:pyridoxal phosphate enzyme (YggS family)